MSLASTITTNQFCYCQIFERNGRNRRIKKEIKALREKES